MAFLDVMVSKTESSFKFSLYSKPSRSDHVIPWDSNHPRSTLRNILRNDLGRAIKNGSDDFEIQKGIDLITRRYRCNGYPSSFIRNARQSLNNRSKEKNKDRIYLSLSYHNERDTREIRNSLKKTGLHEFVSFSFTSRPLHRVLSPRDEIQCTRSSCVYCQRGDGHATCCYKGCVYLLHCLKCPSEGQAT